MPQSSVEKAFILADNERRFKQFTLSRADTEDLFKFKDQLSKRADTLHAHVLCAYNGLSIYQAIQFQPALRAFFFLFYHGNPAVKLEALTILERHGFTIIKNPLGKGHRLISTRF